MWSRALLLLLLLLTLAGSAQAEKRRLFIVHTNDVHGYIEPYERGGFVRMAAAIKFMRRIFPKEMVLLDAGDTSLGTPISGLSHGKPTAELFDMVDYDAVALGNHEFNWGKVAMRELTDGFHTEVLCANLVDGKTGQNPYKPYTIVERNGVKLAIIGLVAEDTYRRAPAHATEGWQFLTANQAVRSVIPTISEEYDLLITLNHIGIKVDRKLAGQVPEIDLIVGGHSHTPLHQVEYRNHTPIVQAGCYGEYVGVLELLVDIEADSAEVVSYRLLQFDQNSPIDPEAMAIVDRHAEELRPILARKMATIPSAIKMTPEEGCWDTPVGNFITDVFREQAKADIALYNRFGVRFDIEQGDMTVEYVHKLFPFDDPVVVLQATGAQLREVLRQGTLGGEGPLSASGLTALMKGEEIISITVNGKPLRENALYTVATTAFLAGGGDGMSLLKDLKKLKTLDFTRDVLLNYLESHDRIDAPETGRLNQR